MKKLFDGREKSSNIWAIKETSAKILRPIFTLFPFNEKAALKTLILESFLPFQNTSRFMSFLVFQTFLL
jgi:hypothetical protein